MRYMTCSHCGRIILENDDVWTFGPYQNVYCSAECLGASIGEEEVLDDEFIEENGGEFKELHSSDVVKMILETGESECLTSEEKKEQIQKLMDLSEKLKEEEKKGKE